MTRTWNVHFALGCALALVGCDQKPAVWTKEAAQYAVYATQIPLYPGARVTEVMGSHGYGESLSDLVTEGMTWWFKAECTREELSSWYGERLGDATQEQTDDGDIVFTMAVPDGDEGEDMGVIVEQDGVFRVFEHTGPGKHPAD